MMKSKTAIMIKPEPNQRDQKFPAAWIVLALALMGLGIAGRLLPHAPNFSPAASIALFAGFVFPSRWAAAVVILGIMTLSDAQIGGYDPSIMAIVYASLLFPLVFRNLLRNRISEFRVIGASLASSLVFFATTNLAVWTAWYPQTVTGLIECYASALPFFRWTLAGDLCWSCGLFGIYALALRARALTCDSLFPHESSAA